MRPDDRRAALETARVYLVAPGEFPVDVLQAVIEAGVGIVQLRMKDADAAEIVEIGDGWLQACDEAGVPFIVNDRADVALALGADGVHLGQDDLAPEVAREILGPEAIVGRSTHAIDEVERAVTDHGKGLVDYVAVGPIVETPTKPGRPGTGMDLIREAARTIDCPWFATGGIDPSNVAEVVAAGARGVVVVRSIVTAADPVAAASGLRAAFGA